MFNKTYSKETPYATDCISELGNNGWHFFIFRPPADADYLIRRLEFWGLNEKRELVDIENYGWLKNFEVIISLNKNIVCRWAMWSAKQLYELFLEPKILKMRDIQIDIHIKFTSVQIDVLPTTIKVFIIGSLLS